MQDNDDLKEAETLEASTKQFDHSFSNDKVRNILYRRVVYESDCIEDMGYKDPIREPSHSEFVGSGVVDSFLEGNSSSDEEGENSTDSEAQTERDMELLDGLVKVRQILCDDQDGLGYKNQVSQFEPSSNLN